MILRQRTPSGVNRDVDYGPSSGIRWNAPIGGVQVVAPSRQGGEGKGRWDRPESPRWNEHTADYQRQYRERKRRERALLPRCEKLMPKAGELCGRMPGHKDHCKSRYAMDHESVAAVKRKR